MVVIDCLFVDFVVDPHTLLMTVDDIGIDYGLWFGCLVLLLVCLVFDDDCLFDIVWVVVLLVVVLFRFARLFPACPIQQPNT